MSFHEAAHAWMANRLGDATARFQGRLTLNPIPHIDPIGTIVMPLVGFMTGWAILAWAKPVPFDPRNLKHPRKDSMWIALAGPASNFILMLVFAGMIHLSPFFIDAVANMTSVFLAKKIMAALGMVFFLNIVLCLFNLLPFDPLDGGKILRGVLPHRLAVRVDYFFRLNQRWIMIAFFILIFTGIFGRIIVPAIVFFGSLFLGDKLGFILMLMQGF